MYREIITANAPTHEIKIPLEMRGKKVEILAFEIESQPTIEANGKTNLDISAEEFFSGHRVDMSDFKFSRDEANDYE